MGNTKVVVKVAQKPDQPVVSTAAAITAIKQTEATKLAAEFSADMTGIKYTDLKIVRDETGAVVTVKSTTVDKKDNTKVAIETYEALTDGKSYTVTYTAADEAKTESSATFTATDGKVSDIALNTYSIPANTLTEIKYQTLDANGVVIAEAGIGSSAANNMEISVENANGYQNNNELLLYKTGDKATVKVVYHTWKYSNTDGKEEGKVEKSFTITAVDQSSVIETYDYSVAKMGAAIDFKRDKLVQQLAMDDDKAADPYAYFSFRTAADKDITKSLDYTVSSGNENVLLASGTVAGGAKLTPVGVGATYLVIKNASGAVVKTLPINVVAKRALSTMTVDRSNVTVADSTADGVGSEKITVAVMDQYSDNYSKYSVAQPVLRSNNNPGSLSVTATKGTDHKTVITVSAAGGANVGTYSYTMDLVDSENANNTKKVSFSVTVSKTLASAQTYALVMMNVSDVVSKVDTTVTTDAYSATTLVPTIVTKNNGSITGKANNVVSISAIKLTKNGATVDNKNNIYGSSDGTIANAQVKVTEINGSVIKKNLEPGTYTVSFKATITVNGTNKVQDMSTSFVVEDSQKVFEVSVKKQSVANGKTTLKDVFEDTDYATFAYAGNELDKAEYTYTYDSADTTKINANSIRVNKVTMNVVLPGTNGKTVQMTAAVNRTFTFGNAISTPDVVKTAIANIESSYTATSTSAAIISNYLTTKSNFDQLTASEKTTALTASMAAIKTKAETVATNIVKDVANGGTSALTLDVTYMLDVTGAKLENLNAYTAAIKADATFKTSATKTELDPMIADINTLAAVTVSVNTDGKIVLANFTGTTYTTDGLLDPDASSDTTYSSELTIKTGATAGKLVIKATTYKVTYTYKEDGGKAVRTDDPVVYGK